MYWLVCFSVSPPLAWAGAYIALPTNELTNDVIPVLCIAIFVFVLQSSKNFVILKMSLFEGTNEKFETDIRYRCQTYMYLTTQEF